MSESTSRRDFLAVTAAAVATAGCGNNDPNSLSTDPGGDPANFAPSSRQPTNPGGTDAVCGATTGFFVGPAAQDLGLNQVIGPILNAPGNVSPFYVCRDSQGIFGMTNKCTHLGCTPNFEPDFAIWRCPCHGSRYDVTGRVIFPPAVMNMTRYAACKGADGLIHIDLSKKLP